MSGPAPFSRKGVLGLVLVGTMAFVALLYLIGAGALSGPLNNGGSHAGGTGLNGFAGFARLVEARGHPVRVARSPSALDDAGLLVLTPEFDTDGKELERIVAARRHIGPTLVITPKWVAAPAPPTAPKARKGWVVLGGTEQPDWPGFLDDVKLIEDHKPVSARFSAAGIAGTLPKGVSVVSGQGDRLMPVVLEPGSGRILAAWIGDDGIYPALEEATLGVDPGSGKENDLYPLVIVFEPDLIDNYGLARRENAVLADALVSAASERRRDMPVIFDVTLNGLGRSANLLTLAFTPPYLAATLCLILAALVAGWRAFMRFGPAARTRRALAFGKRALVANAAGLIRRARRLHLLPAPYADAARERLVKALALSRHDDAARTEAAIDRALAARDPAAEPFSDVAARLRAATRAPAILAAAQDLHAIERKLTR